jgi:signal transduction histidine kinase
MIPGSSSRRTKNAPLAANFMSVRQLIRNIVRRSRRADPFKADLLLALFFVATMVLEASIERTDGGSRLATAIAGSAAVMTVAWRRRNPFAAVLAFSGLCVVQPLVDSFFFGSQTNTPFVAGLLMSYSAGRHLSGRRLWIAGAAVIACVDAGVAMSQTYEGPSDLLWVFILFLPPALAGQAIRSRVALRRELRAKAERLEAEREVAAQRAVEEERNRIASELQAVVANGVSAMVVQAEAVPRLLAAEDAERARDAFEVIEETGRDALAEMRRLLGVLRREGDRAELAPQPGLARLDALVERLRENGLPVVVGKFGAYYPLAQGVDLTAYRVIHDGLEAAQAAGATSAKVTLRYGDRDLEIDVADNRPAGAGAGSAPAGLKERVGLYDGHLRCSRKESGDHLLEARLPARSATDRTALAGEPA